MVLHQEVEGAGVTAPFASIADHVGPVAGLDRFDVGEVSPAGLAVDLVGPVVLAGALRLVLGPVGDEDGVVGTGLVDIAAGR